MRWPPQTAKADLTVPLAKKVFDTHQSVYYIVFAMKG